MLSVADGSGWNWRFCSRRTRGEGLAQSASSVGLTSTSRLERFAGKHTLTRRESNGLCRFLRRYAMNSICSERGSV